MAVALVAAGLVGGLGATAANAAFDDVPTEGAYTEHITNLQEAGIATGYSDGSFRPSADMNRRQTAAWINRAAARVGLDYSGSDTLFLDGENLVGTVAEVEMTSPAAGSGEGWVTLFGGVGAIVTANGDQCPCLALVRFRNSADEIVGQSVLTVIDNGNGVAFSTSPTFAAVPLAAGATETYRLEVELTDPDVSIAVAGAAYGNYAPLADGDPEQVGDLGTASDGADAVESLVPEIDFGG